jgi:outer membrane immunogenic protein
MKKIAAAATFLALTAGPALAADMPLKAAPVPVASVYNWTGFYIGLNAGYGWGDASSRNDPIDAASQSLFAGFNPSAFNTGFHQRGAIAGGQIGYNWQLSSRMVAGLETDLQWSDVHGRDFRTTVINTGVLVPFNSIAERQFEWFGTLRGRLGFLAAPNVLLYGTGGLAYGEARTNGEVTMGPTPSAVLLFTSPPGGSSFTCQTSTAGATSSCYAGHSRETSLGWSAGAGAEYLIAGSWTAKLEYLHVDLPGNSVVLVSPSPPSTPGVSTIYRLNHQAYDFVRVGFNYKFGAGGGPVVAKY